MRARDAAIATYNTSNTLNNTKGRHTPQPGPFLQQLAIPSGSPARRNAAPTERIDSSRRSATAMRRPRRGTDATAENASKLPLTTLALPHRFAPAAATARRRRRGRCGALKNRYLDDDGAAAVVGFFAERRRRRRWRTPRAGSGRRPGGARSCGAVALTALGAAATRVFVRDRNDVYLRPRVATYMRPTTTRTVRELSAGAPAEPT